MTDQSPNSVFHASSFLQVQNADRVGHLRARHCDKPTRDGTTPLRAKG
jgi:hypothetical protein